MRGGRLIAAPSLHAGHDDCARDREDRMNAAWKGHIRMLVYVVQFQTDPVAAAKAAVDRVLRDQPAITPADLRFSIQQALASNERLAELIPQDHDERTIRAFLTSAAVQLAAPGL